MFSSSNVFFFFYFFALHFEKRPDNPDLFSAWYGDAKVYRRHDLMIKKMRIDEVKIPALSFEGENSREGIHWSCILFTMEEKHLRREQSIRAMMTSTKKIRRKLESDQCVHLPFHPPRSAPRTRNTLATLAILYFVPLRLYFQQISLILYFVWIENRERIREAKSSFFALKWRREGFPSFLLISRWASILIKKNKKFKKAFY